LVLGIVHNYTLSFVQALGCFDSALHILHMAGNTEHGAAVTQESCSSSGSDGYEDNPMVTSGAGSATVPGSNGEVDASTLQEGQIKLCVGSVRMSMSGSGNLALAREWWLEASAIFGRVGDTAGKGQAQYMLAMLYSSMDDRHQARVHAEAATRLLEEALGAKHRRSRKAQRLLVELRPSTVRDAIAAVRAGVRCLLGCVCGCVMRIADAA
jgi:hypothetical protein